MLKHFEKSQRNIHEGVIGIHSNVWGDFGQIVGDVTKIHGRRDPNHR